MGQLGLEQRVTQLYRHLWTKIERIDGPEIVDQFLRNVGLPGGWFQSKRSLDVGCGSGFAAFVLQVLGSESHACDLGFESVRDARARLSNCPLNSSVYLISASALSLPYRSESFDFVHCSGVLHHTVDPWRGFQELVRVTRPGGVLFVGVYGKGGVYNVGLSVARSLARAIPFEWTETAVQALLGDRRVPHSFMPASVSMLDNLYVPVRRRFREREVRQWFTASGFKGDQVVRTKTTIFDHTTTLNRVIHGEGYIQLRGYKRC